MALSSSPVSFARGVVAASGTAVAFSAQPPDNCHTILVTNPSDTVVGLVGFATAAMTAGVNAQRVPPSSTITLALGTTADRNSITTFSADSIGGAVTLEASYLNKNGPV